nr:hypothetical protein [uncultured Cellulosilyticum sp.]
MQTYFWREGRAVSYEELLEILKQIINRKVIDELADDEIDKLYVKVCDTAYLSMKKYLEEKNFKIINPKQGLLTAYQVKLVQDKGLWDEALERKKLIEEGVPSYKQAYEKGLKNFIKEDYYPALKAMESKLGTPHFGNEE